MKLMIDMSDSEIRSGNWEVLGDVEQGGFQEQWLTD